MTPWLVWQSVWFGVMRSRLCMLRSDPCTECNMVPHSDLRYNRMASPTSEHPTVSPLSPTYRLTVHYNTKPPKACKTKKFSP